MHSEHVTSPANGGVVRASAQGSPGQPSNSDVYLAKKKSISAYTDELKERVARAESADSRNSESEQSSGYVIDYEQVLKDNSTGHTPPPQRHQALMSTNYREDVC